MVSPLNSFVGLDAAGPGVDPSLPAALYPDRACATSCASIPTDDLEGAALALLARDRGANARLRARRRRSRLRRASGDGVRDGRRRLGLEVRGAGVLGSASGRATAALARRVADSGAAAVFVGGLIDTNAGGVIRDLRRRPRGRSISSGRAAWRPCSLLVKKSDGAARRHVPQPPRHPVGAAASRRRPLGERLRRHAARRPGRAFRRLRRAGDRGAPRRDRALGRDAALRRGRAVPHARSRTACSEASGSTRTATSPKAR